MTLLKKYIKLLLVLCAFTSQGNSQNLYDLEHSQKYADFLFQSRQYKLAAMEFERISFLDPENIDIRLKLVSSYRLSDQYKQGLEKLQKWYPLSIPNRLLFLENTKLNLLNGNYAVALNTLTGEKVLSEGEGEYYTLSSLLMQKNWTGANGFISNNHSVSWPGFAELSSLSERQKHIKYKKPGISLAMSAVIPGLGKVYSKDWKDGIISFLFVATNAYQAYRGFSKDGINSVYGWIFGSLAFGFYTGNLFGSWKAARDYNFRSEEVIYNEIQESIYNRF